MTGAARTHPLAGLLRQAADGDFPHADGQVQVVPPAPPGQREWVVSFTGHAVVATSRPAVDVHARKPDGFGGALAPAFLLWLAGPDGSVGCQDAVLVARGRGGGTLPARRDLDGHPRVRYARSLRDEVAVHGDDRGFVTLGTGLAGLAEMSIEVEGRADTGSGRQLIEEALALVPDGELVLAQVTPGNARSLRAFLASGFVPIGSAVSIAQRASTAPPDAGSHGSGA